ncbi:hypothetical protein ABZ379_50070 [Streptomyces canus]|uniref:hypothetical protein n=1 Tax=Streptomyces canus TaxID=58343 RepID=UPI0033CA867E
MPEETARIARAAFPKASLAMRIRGELFSDADFAGLYPSRGKPAWAPGKLAPADPGFDHSVLTESRDRLVDAGIQLMDRVLEVAVERGLLKAGGRARTDSTILLCADFHRPGRAAKAPSVRSFRVLQRPLVRLGETLRPALNTVAAHEPKWLADWVPSE